MSTGDISLLDVERCVVSAMLVLAPSLTVFLGVLRTFRVVAVMGDVLVWTVVVIGCDRDVWVERVETPRLT